MENREQVLQKTKKGSEVSVKRSALELAERTFEGVVKGVNDQILTDRINLFSWDRNRQGNDKPACAQNSAYQTNGTKKNYVSGNSGCRRLR